MMKHLLVFGHRLSLDNTYTLVSVCLAAIFLGMNKNGNSIAKGLFYLPTVTYGTYLVTKKPWVIVMYCVFYCISKWFSDRIRNTIEDLDNLRSFK